MGVSTGVAAAAAKHTCTWLNNCQFKSLEIRKMTFLNYIKLVILRNFVKYSVRHYVMNSNSKVGIYFWMREDQDFERRRRKKRWEAEICDWWRRTFSYKSNRKYILRIKISVETTRPKISQFWSQSRILSYIKSIDQRISRLWNCEMFDQ